MPIRLISAALFTASSPRTPVVARAVRGVSVELSTDILSTDILCQPCRPTGSSCATTPLLDMSMRKVRPPEHSFDRVFTAHFYGHLPHPERDVFLREVARV